MWSFKKLWLLSHLIDKGYVIFVNRKPPLAGVHTCVFLWDMLSDSSRCLLLVSKTLIFTDTPETNKASEMDGWKMKFPFGKAYFQGRTVGFREGRLLGHAEKLDEKSSCCNV